MVRCTDVINKDPDSVLDYSFDWSEWLAPVNDQILSFTMTAVGVTFTALPIDPDRPNVATAMVAGGTPYHDASLTCRITTEGGRVEDATIYFAIANK